MKKVIYGQELQDKILESISLLCGSVKHTLGPKGCNVLISSDEASPYITNDGVTIARNVSSENPVMDSILEIAKESSLKTNEMVGDGTTTTLVLLEKMIEKGQSFLQKGVNAMTLKKEMEECLEHLLQEIAKKKERPTDEDYLQVAISSSNDLELGKLAFQVFQQIGQKNGIKILESEKEKTTYQILKGYSLETNVLKDLLEIDSLKNVSILLIDGDLESLEEIGEILNECISHKNHLFLLANHFQEEVRNEMLSYSLEHDHKIILCETPEYGRRRLEILKDLEAISNSKIWHKNLNEPVQIECLGFSKQLEFYTDMILFTYQENHSIKLRKELLQKQILDCESVYEKTFLEERFSMLNVGYAFIYVGGISRTSIREKKMRMEDAICALDCTKHGIVPSSSFTLYTLQGNQTIRNDGDSVVLSSLDAPYRQILVNSGFQPDEILSKIQKLEYSLFYNVQTNQFEKVSSITVKDPLDVVITSLKNAVSIASMLLTTSYLIIHERKEFEKEL